MSDEIDKLIDLKLNSPDSKIDEEWLQKCETKINEYLKAYEEEIYTDVFRLMTGITPNKLEDDKDE